MSSRWLNIAASVLVPAGLVSVAACVGRVEPDSTDEGSKPVPAPVSSTVVNPPPGYSPPTTSTTTSSSSTTSSSTVTSTTTVDGGFDGGCGAAPPEMVDGGGPTGGFVTLASDSHVQLQIAVAAGSVYWIDRGAGVSDTVQTVLTSGGAEQLFYNPSTTDAVTIEDIASDGSSLYIAEYDTTTGTSKVTALAFGRGAPYTIATEPVAGSAILGVTAMGGAVYFTDGAAVYLITSASGNVPSDPSEPSLVTTVRAADPGTTINLLMADPPADSIEGTNVYWVEAGASSAAVLFFGDHPPAELVASNAGAAASNGPTLYYSSGDVESTTSSLFGCSVPGGTTTPFVSLPGNTLSIGVDSANLYVTAAPASALSTYSLQAIPTGGGPAVTLIAGFGSPTQGTTAHGVGLDDSYVYIPTTTGILRASR